MRISTPLWLSAILSTIALFAFCATLFVELRIARSADILRADTRETIGTANAILSSLKDIETGSRGFLLTGLDRYLEPFAVARNQLPALQQDLHALTETASPAVRNDVARLDDLVRGKVDDATRLIEARRDGGSNFKVDLASLDRGKRDMDDARALVAKITTEGRARLDAIDADVAALRRSLLTLTLAGFVFVSLIVIAATILSLRAIASRLSRLQSALGAMGRGERELSLGDMGHGDFSKVASAFNAMAERLAGEEARRNEKELELEDYSRAVNLVRRMADRLPGCADEVEFSAVIQSFAPQLTHGRSGALYLLNDSRNLLHVGSSWGDATSSKQTFAPSDCWALRRGQEHVSGAGHVEIPCRHVVQDRAMHWCVPLVAQSETVGLLYLAGREEIETAKHDPGDVTHMLSESIALALVNLRLREKLRSQSVRDPLTGLYNRRYLDESLDLELARAARSQDPVATIMLDIDHFKKFNDTFGHEAGDLVLKGVADVLARSMRKGDIAGRFGGEEFLLIMPGADVERAVDRANAMREAIAGLELSRSGQKLGRVTASFGVATFSGDGETGQALVQAADKALYAAKGAGRNRVVAADSTLA